MKARNSGIFPDMPRDNTMVDKTGELTAHWALFFENLVTALQTNFNRQGITVPPLDTTTIGTLIGNASFNNIVYDSTNKQFDGNIQGEWIPFSMITTYAGNPNGHVAGQLYWFCLNTVGNQLYYCSTAGSASGIPLPQAIWTIL